MGKKDSITKKYLKDDKVFKDCINYFLFNGEERIFNLRDLSPESIIMEPNIHRIRDLYKEVLIKEDDNYKYLLVGIESQSSINNGMLLRCLMYDVLSYDMQAYNIVNSHKDAKIKLDYYSSLRKNDKLKPVITIVIYFGYKKWTGPKELFDLLDVNDSIIKSYMFNYKMNIIEPNRMDDFEFNKFKTDLGKILKLIKYSNDKNKIKELIYTKEYTKISLSAGLLLKEVCDFNFTIEETEGDVDMCKGIRDLVSEAQEDALNKGKAQGLVEGKAQGLVEGKAQGKVEGETTANNKIVLNMRKNGMSDEEISKVTGLNINFVSNVK